ncbi:MAG: NERD domain-containing protein/DEAD/DEAH box helicase [Sulfuricella sp.]|nr:NERD domain-containing protein/DEAD/DEAH box helicase [Sulfuricella sp.]
MATLIPSLGSARFDARGELRLAERLKDFLEDNAWVWHNIPVGPFGRHPDFVVLHPHQGIVVLEVKDWHRDTIVGATSKHVELLTPQGTVSVESPFEQVRNYMFHVMDTLKREPLLVNESGSFKGKPVFSFGHGVAFTNITRKQFEQTDLHEVFPPERCIFRDEMSENVDPDAFRERVWRMVSPRIGPALSLPQIDRVRARLFPEIRVTQIALPFDEPTDETSPADDRMLTVMDMQQELLARSMGEGHRIVRGVAGSGKTLILAFRAEQIARAAARPVLLLSYANGISGRLENAMQDRGVEDKVIVSTFHSWCFRMLRDYGLPIPNQKDFPDSSDRYAASVQAVLDASERGLIPGGQYDAVLIDEAHDFEPQWLALAAKMVNPDTKALMIVYDDAQAIYKGRKRPVWKQLGIEAAGRTTVLKMNYRNTAQILRFARKFVADVIGAPGVCAGDEDAILMPEDAGRQGVEPVVRQCVSYDGEGHAIAEWLLGRKAAGYLWGQMAVLYPRHYIGERFEKILAKQGVPVDVAKAHGNRVQTERDAVRFLSMHNAKGLEFPCVAIGGLGELKKAEDIEDDVRLTYVAITRATHEAFITYSNMSELVGRLVV